MVDDYKKMLSLYTLIGGTDEEKAFNTNYYSRSRSSRPLQSLYIMPRDSFRSLSAEREIFPRAPLVYTHKTDILLIGNLRYNNTHGACKKCNKNWQYTVA
jgi:hypothetical protein